MANIPVVYPYERDELLYSWQRRLATANGFDSIEEFAQVFIYPYTESRKRLLERKVYPDGRVYSKKINIKEDPYLVARSHEKGAS